MHLRNAILEQAGFGSKKGRTHAQLSNPFKLGMGLLGWYLLVQGIFKCEVELLVFTDGLKAREWPLAIGLWSQFPGKSYNYIISPETPVPYLCLS